MIKFSIVLLNINKHSVDMQKSKSKSKGKPTKPTKQTPPKIIDSTEQPALIGELNLNQIDVEVLVRE